MTHGQPRIMCIRRRHPIRPTVWGMPSVGKGEAPSLFWPQPSASLTPPSPGPPLRTTAADGLHVRRTTFEASSPFYSWKFVYMGLVGIS